MSGLGGLSLNLDPDSYSPAEVCSLLGVPADAPSAQIIEARETLSRQLRAAGTGGLGSSEEVGLFLDSITTKVLNTRQSAESSGSTLGTWAQAETPITEYGSNVLITSADTIAGRKAKISGGRVANSGDAPPGYLNPINVRTLMHAVNIDSRFRPNYFSTPSTDFRMELPEVQRKVVSIRVGSMELPLTFYAISESLGNAHLMVKVGSDFYLIKVPDGNYEQSWARQSRAAHIERTMNEALMKGVKLKAADDKNEVFETVGSTSPADTDLTYLVDRASGRSLFGSKGKISSFTIYFNIEVKKAGDGQQVQIDPATNMQLRLGWQLGFRASTYSVDLTTNGGEGICSEAPCHITGPRYGLLSINDHQRNASSSFTVAFGESSLDTNIISRINLAPAVSGDGVFQSIDAPGLSTSLNRTREYFGPVDIQRLDVRLLDEYGRVIDLNGTDWSFSLAFEKMYD